MVPFTEKGNTGEGSCLGEGEKIDSVWKKVILRVDSFVSQQQNI
jgi:hypothetical protein